MHELTIASALVDQVCEYARNRPAKRVVEIGIRMGALSGITRALHFCFPAAARGTLCEGAVLYIDEVPLTVMCSHCDSVKTPAALYNFRCPDCGRPTPQVITGREMQLVSIELAGLELDHTATETAATAPCQSLPSQRM
jgi:hydrogenase nickel incorporation protein HypA/HybF